MRSAGSPSISTRSASLPGSIEPVCASVCVKRAPFQVAILSTCAAGIPACTYSSNSRCKRKPAQPSVPATNGTPALCMRPISASILAYDRPKRLRLPSLTSIELLSKPRCVATGMWSATMP